MISGTGRFEADGRKRMAAATARCAVLLLLRYGPPSLSSHLTSPVCIGHRWCCCHHSIKIAIFIRAALRGSRFAGLPIAVVELVQLQETLQLVGCCFVSIRKVQIIQSTYNVRLVHLGDEQCQKEAHVDEQVRKSGFGFFNVQTRQSWRSLQP